MDFRFKYNNINNRPKTQDNNTVPITNHTKTPSERIIKHG